MNYDFVAVNSEKKLRGILLSICCEKKDSELRTALEQMALQNK